MSIKKDSAINHEVWFYLHAEVSMVDGKVLDVIGDSLTVGDRSLITKGDSYQQVVEVLGEPSQKISFPKIILVRYPEAGLGIQIDRDNMLVKLLFLERIRRIRP